jgi:hypothetical protein
VKLDVVLINDKRVSNMAPIQTKTDVTQQRVQYDQQCKWKQKSSDQYSHFCCKQGMPNPSSEITSVKIVFISYCVG